MKELGFLERLEAKLERIEKAIDCIQKFSGAIQGVVEETSEGLPMPPVGEVETAAPLPPISEVEQTALPPAAPHDVELDSDGVPWDERIHSSSKKRNKAGTGPWAKRKGITDELYTQVTQELKAAQAGKSAQAAPGLAGGSAPSPEGMAPPAPTTQAPPTPDNKRIAIEAINKLTKECNVNYDAVIQYFIDNFNVTGFDQLRGDDFEAVANDINLWVGRFKSANDLVAKIRQIYVANVSVIEPYITQCFNHATLQDIACTKLEDVAYDRLDPVEQALATLHNQCSNPG